MKWSIREARPGDMIRVRIGSIYHYGVFASEQEVIQFGLPPSLRQGVPEDQVEVLATDINTFRCGAFPEAADLSFSERRHRRPPAEAVETARSRIGEKGYHLLYNNCEHFAWECVMGKKYSSQVEDVRAAVRKIKEERQDNE